MHRGHWKILYIQEPERDLGRLAFPVGGIYRKFQSCLKDAGFSDPEITSTVTEIEDRVNRHLKQNGVK